MNCKNNNILGFCLAFISAALFGLLGIFNNIGITSGLTTSQLVCTRFIIASIIMYFLAKYKGHSIKLEKQILKKVLAGGLFYFLPTTYFIFRAYNYIGMGLATVLCYTFPIMILFASIIVDKQKVNVLQIMGTFISFIGLVVVIGPMCGNNIIGIFLSLFTALTYTLYFRFLAKPFAEKIDNSVLMFWVFNVSAVALIIPSLFEIITKPQVFNIPGVLTSTFGLAVVDSVFAFSLLNIAIRYIGARMSSIISMFDPIVAILLGVIFLHESLTSNFAFGIIMILSGTFFVTFFENKKKDSVELIKIAINE